MSVNIQLVRSLTLILSFFTSYQSLSFLNSVNDLYESWLIPILNESLLSTGILNFCIL